MAAVIPIKLIVGSPNQFARLVVGDTIAATYLDPLVLTTTNTATVSGKTFTSLKINTTEYATYGSLLGSVSGAKVLDLAESTTPDNRLKLTTSDTVAGVATLPIDAVGGATTIHVDITPKGASGKLKTKGVEVVDLSSTQSLSNKTYTAPIIAASDWGSATHAHTSSATGGALSASAITSGTLNAARVVGSDQRDFSASDLADGGAASIIPLGIEHLSEATVAATALTANRRDWIPFFAPRRVLPIISQLHCYIAAGWAIGRQWKVGIYSSNGSLLAPRPNALLTNGTDIFDLNTGGAGNVTVVLGTTTTFTPGALYWLCLWSNTGVPTVSTYPTAGVIPTSVLGVNRIGLDGLTQVATNLSPLWGFTENTAYAASLPSSAPALNLDTAVNGVTWRTGPRWVIGATYTS